MAKKIPEPAWMPAHARLYVELEPYPWFVTTGISTLPERDPPVIFYVYHDGTMPPEFEERKVAETIPLVFRKMDRPAVTME